MFYALHFSILNLIIVSDKVNLQLSCLQFFPTLSCKQLKLERPSMEKLKFKQLDGLFEMLRFFGRGFCVCANLIL